MPRRTKKKEAAQEKEEEPEVKVSKEEKSEPAAKQPRKFVKKSIDAMQRIARSKHQRIFLLSAERGEEEWTFKVLGVVVG